jgi:hypothetical protein
VSGQHHAPAALYLQGKSPRYPLYRRLGGTQSRSGHRGGKGKEMKRKNPLLGIELRRPVRSRTELPGCCGCGPAYTKLCSPYVDICKKNTFRSYCLPFREVSQNTVFFFYGVYNDVLVECWNDYGRGIGKRCRRKWP